MPRYPKTQSIYILIEHFVKYKEIRADDKYIYEEILDCSKKTLNRYLDEIYTNYRSIIKIGRGSKSVYRLITVSDIFEEFLNISENIEQVMDMAEEFGERIGLDNIYDEIIDRISVNPTKERKDVDIFIFKNSPVEMISSEKKGNIFNKLKDAIRRKKYINIVYNYDGVIHLKELLPLRLLFTNNNWYIVVVDRYGGLSFRRISFIEKITYSKDKGYSKDITKYLEFLKRDVQNAMTLFGADKKVAKIKANRNIAKYFDKGMKKILPSQEFISKDRDGSIIFQVKYTQELEILPLIQKWMPDLIILEPVELKERYISKLKESLRNYGIYVN